MRLRALPAVGEGTTPFRASADGRRRPAPNDVVVDAAWGDAPQDDASPRVRDDGSADRLAALDADRLAALEAKVRDLDARLVAAPASTPVAQESSKLADRIVDRVDALADRIDTLSETARAAASGLVARERELASIRHDLQDARSRVDVAVSDFRQRVSPAPIDALRRSITALSDRVAAFVEQQEELTGKLAGLVDASGADRSTITSHERGLAELSSGLEAANERMDSVVATVRQAVESLLTQVGASGTVAVDRADPSLAERLESLAGTVESLVAEGQSSAAAAAEREERLATRLEELARRLDALDARPRLVSWGSRSPEGDREAHGDELDGASEPDPGRHSSEGSDLESGDLRRDTRGPIVTFGGGA